MTKKNETPKQSYQSPKLKDFGPVEQLTKGPGGNESDVGAGSMTGYDTTAP